MNTPNYSYPPGLLIRVARDVLLLHRRDFHEDAKTCIAALRPPLQVWGRENVPQAGPCVLTINHFHRPGFRAQWLTLAVSASVPVPVHWLITGELVHWRKQLGPIGSIGSRLLLERIASIYGFTTTPPMPPRAGDAEARAASVRAVLSYVRSTKAPVLGLAPEGQDSPNGVLMEPASGLGRFALLLSRAGLAFLPVGVYEEGGCMQVRFGERYSLTIRRELPVNEKDAQAAQILMQKIACLLPVHLRGEFA